MTIKRFLLIHYIGLSLWLLFQTIAGNNTTLLTYLFLIVASLVYPAWYLLGPITITWIFKKSPRVQVMLVIASVAITWLILIGDYRLHDLYGFHINGFVLNLIFTPGGIESLGASSATFVTLMLGVAVLIALCVASYWLIHRWWNDPTRLALPLGRLYAGAIGICVALGFVYGFGFYKNDQSLIRGAERIAFFQPIFFSHELRRMGVAPGATGDQITLKQHQGRLAYPQKPIQQQAEVPRYNIVWLAAESWRWDMLTPEIMPATYAFAGRSHRFLNHYSGGNGTRVGIFTMFYGVYGSYWFSFLNERRGPVFFDVLNQNNYQYALFTSAKFTYPEFNDTVFSTVPAENKQEFFQGAGWERDRKNTTDLVAFLKHHDTSRPFMSFMFYESPHADYHFPPESVIREDYVEEVNYATMDVKADAPRLKNRYINSCHHLDSQFARVLKTLEQEKLLDNTIVIITGDHGEEFMEKGRWGHNSEFHQEQIRTPLVIWMPGSGAKTYDKMTSHMDIAPSILRQLGVTNPLSEYSLATDLFDDTQQRQSTVVADWNGIGIITAKDKITLSMQGQGLGGNYATIDDTPIPSGSFLSAHPALSQNVLQKLTVFSH